jgi:transposase
MEACVGAHHLSRKLQAHGHDARLMPAKYVRAYSKGQKNDFRDQPIISSAMVAAIGNGDVFSKGRDFAAWLGLVPRQLSTGDRTILGKISKAPPPGVA